MLYKGLGRGFYAVVTARFVNRFGDFVRFLLVLLLSLKLGFSESAVGFISTLCFASTFIGQMLSGLLSDRFSRSRLLPLCQAMTALCYFLAIPMIGRNNAAIVMLILLSSVFRGAAYPITNAITADLVPAERRQEAFSLLYLVTNIGVAAGSIVAGLLFESLFFLFLLSAVMMLLDSLIVMKYVPYIRPAERKAKRGIRGSYAISGTVLFIAAFSAVRFFYNFMYQSTVFVLPLEISSIYGPEAGPSYYSYISMANAAAVIVLTSSVTAITAKRDTVRNMVASMAFYVLGLALFAFSSSMFMFLFSMIIWTVGEILMATNANSFLNDSIPDETRGLYNSICIGIESLGGAAAPSVCGLILSSVSYTGIWTALSLMSVLIAFSYAGMRRFAGRRH